MEWISVKNRLPPEGQEVLTYKKGCVRNVYRVDYLVYLTHSKTKYRWVNRTPGEYAKITHWMEIPKEPIIFCKKCHNEKIACSC